MPKKTQTGSNKPDVPKKRRGRPPKALSTTLLASDTSEGLEAPLEGLNSRLEADPVKLAQFDALKAAVNQKYGKGSMMGQGEHIEIPKISLDHSELDRILGGGIPKGRIIEVYGPESAGKTSLTLKIISAIQSTTNERGIFIDVEHSLDPNYAEEVGVDLSRLEICQPMTGEEALDIAEMAVKSGAVNVVVVDSVAALASKAELEGAMGDAHVGLQARLMSQALRKLNAAVSKSGCILIFTNQLREKVNTFGHGSPETTSGGRALKFYASIRIDVRYIGKIKRGETFIGQETKVKIQKNKVSPPYKTATIDLYYPGFDGSPGFCKYSSLLTTAQDMGLVTKSGSSLKFKPSDTQIGVGLQNCRKALQKDQKLYNSILKAVKAHG